METTRTELKMMDYEQYLGYALACAEKTLTLYESQGLEAPWSYRLYVLKLLVECQRDVRSVLFSESEAAQ